MSVSCSGWLGYVVDIQEICAKAERVNERLLNRWIGFEDMTTELEDRYGFVPYYSKRPKEERITILYDGMCGEYVKLIYVIQSATDMSTDYSDDRLVDAINSKLETCNVPSEVVDRLSKVYNEIRRIAQMPATDNFNVKLEYVKHYT